MVLFGADQYEQAKLPGAACLHKNEIAYVYISGRQFSLDVCAGNGAHAINIKGARLYLERLPGFESFQYGCIQFFGDALVNAIAICTFAQPGAASIREQHGPEDAITIGEFIGNGTNEFERYFLKAAFGAQAQQVHILGKRVLHRPGDQLLVLDRILGAAFITDHEIGRSAPEPQGMVAGRAEKSGSVEHCHRFSSLISYETE